MLSHVQYDLDRLRTSLAVPAPLRSALDHHIQFGIRTSGLRDEAFYALLFEMDLLRNGIWESSDAAVFHVEHQQTTSSSMLS